MKTLLDQDHLALYIHKVEVPFNTTINMNMSYGYNIPGRYDFTRLFDYYTMI